MSRSFLNSGTLIVKKIQFKVDYKDGQARFFLKSANHKSTNFWAHSTKFRWCASSQIVNLQVLSITSNPHIPNQQISTKYCKTLSQNRVLKVVFLSDFYYVQRIGALHSIFVRRKSLHLRNCFFLSPQITKWVRKSRIRSVTFAEVEVVKFTKLFNFAKCAYLRFGKLICGPLTFGRLRRVLEVVCRLRAEYVFTYDIYM
jgi:hypothetical protein